MYTVFSGNIKKDNKHPQIQLHPYMLGLGVLNTEQSLITLLNLPSTFYNKEKKFS